MIDAQVDAQGDYTLSPAPTTNATIISQSTRLARFVTVTFSLDSKTPEAS